MASYNNKPRAWSYATGNMYHKYCSLPLITEGDTSIINIDKNIYKHCIDEESKDNVCNMLESVLSIINGSYLMIATSDSAEHPPNHDTYTKLICDGSHCHMLCALLQFIWNNDVTIPLNLICPHSVNDEAMFKVNIVSTNNQIISSYGLPLYYKLHISGQDNYIYIQIIENMQNLYTESDY